MTELLCKAVLQSPVKFAQGLSDRPPLCLEGPPTLTHKVTNTLIILRDSGEQLIGNILHMSVIQNILVCQYF